MKTKIFIRKLHRWLGLLMALQIVAWMASGLYFSIFPIETIRGEHLTRSAVPPERERLASLGSPAVLGATLEAHFGADWELTSLQLSQVGDQLLWRVEARVDEQTAIRLVTADGRKVQPRLTAEQAAQRAQGWLNEPAELHSIALIDQEPENLEFRGRPLPVWQARLNHPESLVLYLDPWTGELLARRTDRWRIFDFLWMLHIMDFDTRDDFSTPLLQIAAALGLIVAIGGFIYWTLTTSLLRRRRKTPAAT